MICLDFDLKGFARILLTFSENQNFFRENNCGKMNSFDKQFLSSKVSEKLQQWLIEFVLAKKFPKNIAFFSYFSLYLIIDHLKP